MDQPLEPPRAAVTGVVLTTPWTTAEGGGTLAAMTFDDELDARGLLCPLPVLKCRKRLLGLPDGAVLKVIADDPAAWVDIPHFCGEASHTLLSAEARAEGMIFYLGKGRIP